jgi:hypothetical protein
VIAPAAAKGLVPSGFRSMKAKNRWECCRLAMPSIERFLVSAKFVQDA